MYAQYDHTLQVKLANQANYDSLLLKISGDFPKNIYYAAEKRAKNTWHFVIPDSVMLHHTGFLISGYKNEALHAIGLASYHGATYSVGVNSLTLNKKEHFISLDSASIFTQETDSDIIHSFLATQKDNGTDKYSKEWYEKNLQLYPDASYQMLAILFKYYERYPPLYYEQCFNVLPKSIRELPLGIKLQNYIDNYHRKELAPKIFIDTLLCNLQTGIDEPIIQNKSKYNFIVFSASWCRPCHELIPFVKQLSADLKDNLIITYISLDTGDLQPWKDVIKKYEMPWRCLTAKDNAQKLFQKYDFIGIPHVLLISPENIYKKVDIRTETDRNYIYQLFNK